MMLPPFSDWRNANANAEPPPISFREFSQQKNQLMMILHNLEYKPEREFYFAFGSITSAPNDDDGEYAYAQIWVELRTRRPDTFTGEFKTGYGGRRYLPRHATTSQIVRILFGACMAYEEHEVREAFRYQGARIFGPHIDITALADVADRIEQRPTPIPPTPTTPAPEQCTSTHMYSNYPSSYRCRFATGHVGDHAARVFYIRPDPDADHFVDITWSS